MGQTRPEGPALFPGLNVLVDGTTEGCRLNDYCWGTYMHGILDNPVVLNDLAAACGNPEKSGFNFSEFKQQQYDLLAGHVRKAVDMDYIYSTIVV